MDVAVGNADGQGRIVQGYTRMPFPEMAFRRLTTKAWAQTALRASKLLTFPISNDSLSCYGGLDYPIAAELAQVSALILRTLAVQVSRAVLRHLSLSIRNHSPHITWVKVALLQPTTSLGTNGRFFRRHKM